MPTLRKHARWHLATLDIEKATSIQNLLDRIRKRRDFGVVPARRLMSIETLDVTKTHLPAIPRHLAHILQITRDTPAPCRQRQGAHGRRDPLLRFVALTRRHEELDGPLDGDIGPAQPPRDLPERHRHIKRPLAGLREVLHLLDDRRQLAAPPMIDVT